MSTETKLSLLNRTTLANVAAFVIVIGGLVYGAVKGDTELVKTFTLFGLGYLFGKAKT